MKQKIEIMQAIKARDQIEMTQGGQWEKVKANRRVQLGTHEQVMLKMEENMNKSLEDGRKQPKMTKEQTVHKVSKE